MSDVVGAFYDDVGMSGLIGGPARGVEYADGFVRPLNNLTVFSSLNAVAHDQIRVIWDLRAALNATGHRLGTLAGHHSRGFHPSTDECADPWRGVPGFLSHDFGWVALRRGARCALSHGLGLGGRGQWLKRSVGNALPSICLRLAA